MKPFKFISIANTMAAMSKDPSTKVGAVAIDDNGNIISVGYNGFPRGVLDLESRYADKATKYKLISHAEQNLVAQAAYAGHSLKGSTVILSGLYPCSSCAKSLIQAGVKSILAPNMSPESRWADEAKWAKLMFDEAGVEVQEYAVV
jgi:dCMP deaminase